MRLTDLAIEVHADVGAHVLGADLQDAVLVDAARVRPLRDDVVDDALAQVLRHRVLQHRGGGGWSSASEASWKYYSRTKSTGLDISSET